jgi:FG-GAP repeat
MLLHSLTQIKTKINNSFVSSAKLILFLVLSVSLMMPAFASAAGTDTISSTQFQDPNPQAGDQFGESVAVSQDGSTAVVGAPNYSTGSNGLTGAAYVFTNDGTGWVLATTLLPTDNAMYDRLGVSVAITPDSTQIVVGAFYVPYGNITPVGQGKAYVFSVPQGGWGATPTTPEVTELVASDATPMDNFGWHVSESNDGKTVLVTARYKTIDGKLYNGEAYVYNQPTDGWSSVSSPITEDQILLPSSSLINNRFGWSATLSNDGSQAFVGALGSNSVFQYVEPSGGWGSDQHTITENSQIVAPISDDIAFGFSLALSSDATTIVIGAPYQVVNSNIFQGAAYVYKFDGSQWIYSATLIAQDGSAWDTFGLSVALSQDSSSVLVGAPYRVVNGLTSAGTAYTYGLNSDSTWSQNGELTEPTPAQDDNFGFSVSMLSGSSIFVGAPALTAPDVVTSNAVSASSATLSAHAAQAPMTSSSRIHGGSAYYIRKVSTPPPVIKPTISGFTASAGVGGLVTITGTNLSGATAVSFNGKLATPIISNTATSITVRVPSGATTGKLSITNAKGTVISTTNFVVNPIPAPAITGLTIPATVLGHNVTINGTNLLTVSSVTLNGTSLTIVTKKDKSLVVTIPVGATTGKLLVTTPSGSVESAANVVVPAPTISSLSVTRQQVGKTVTIKGKTFDAVTIVTVNGTVVTNFTKTATSIVITIPAGAKTGYIVVTAPSGMATSKNKLTIY